MKRPGSKRIALCTVTVDGSACCSFNEGEYAHDGGLRAAIEDARRSAIGDFGHGRMTPHACGCARRNVGIGVIVFSGFDGRFEDRSRVVGVTRYEPTPEDKRREYADREVSSKRVRLLVESIAAFERGRDLEREQIRRAVFTHARRWGRK